jgi:hypothetical protein
MTASVNTTTGIFTVSPTGLGSVSTWVTAPNNQVTVFGSTITPTSASAANFALRGGASGNTNYAFGASTTNGAYETATHTAPFPFNAGNKRPCSSCPQPLLLQPDLGFASGVAIGVGMTGVVGGAAAILEAGAAIIPLGMAIGVILVSACIFGMFYDLAQ